MIVLLKILSNPKLGPLRKRRIGSTNYRVFVYFSKFSELTPQMIAEYIEKIVVHEADKSSGERARQVDVYLNFIGKFEVPAPEPAAEEIAAEEKARRKREQRREAQRRYAAKQKAQEQEKQARKKSA